MAIGPLLTDYSMNERILNIIIVPTLLAFYHIILVAIILAMHCALFEKLTQKVSNVPLIDVEKWALDSILLYRKFRDAYSIPLFLTISQK